MEEVKKKKCELLVWIYPLYAVNMFHNDLLIKESVSACSRLEGYSKSGWNPGEVMYLP